MNDDVVIAMRKQKKELRDNIMDVWAADNEKWEMCPEKLKAMKEYRSKLEQLSYEQLYIKALKMGAKMSWAPFEALQESSGGANLRRVVNVPATIEGHKYTIHFVAYGWDTGEDDVDWDIDMFGVSADDKRLNKVPPSVDEYLDKYHDKLMSSVRDQLE